MNSKLFFHENGNICARDVLPLAQSTPLRFDLPPQIARAELFVAAQKHAPSTPALKVRACGVEYSLDAPKAESVCWLRAPIEASGLCGEIEIPAQDGWSLAHAAASGLPIVRVRAWGDGFCDASVHPRHGDTGIETQRNEWLNLLPESLRVLNSRWDWCWRLAEWLAAAWPYANEFQATSYAPWDARIILEWGRAGQDPHGEKPIVMCVHYAVGFVQFCLAMGVPVRAVVLTPDMNSSDGHFVAEVWLEEFGAWAMIDPNLHLCYRDVRTQRPLAVAELFARRDELAESAHFGAGFEAQKNHLEGFARTGCLSGAVYRLWGVWGRHDWIENPDCAPPAHGAVLYAETDIIWCADEEATREELAMFPHFLSSSQLAQM